MFIKLLLVLVCCCQIKLVAEEVILDTCSDKNMWKFINGAEFPGATGGISETADGRVAIDFDFAKGGQYVAAIFKRVIPGNVSSLGVSLQSSDDCRINFRVVDASGRTFQGKATGLIKDRMETVDIKIKGPWQTSWGGTKSSVPKSPLKSFWVMVQAGKTGVKKGKVTILDLKAEVPTPTLKKLTGRNVSLTSCGWNIKASWIDMIDGAALKIKAMNSSAKDAELSLTFPDAFRDQVKRFKLLAKKEKYELVYTPSIEAGGNPYNQYKIRLKLASDDGEFTSVPVTLTGNKYLGSNIGSFYSSTDIETSSVGTAVHFSYREHGAFRGWRPYQMIIDEISACGIKWIRDSCRVEKDKSGVYHVRASDMQWIKYAHRKKIKTILLVWLSPSGDFSERKKMVAAILRDTKGLVDVFELGNEPHNFNWRKKYPGSWNGYEKDGSISRWVKEHLKATNKLADFMKQKRSDITLIGLGACSPTNFHYLNLGVTKSLDGVVDHPYAYSMPPEKIPFGHKLTKRDGIKIGDANHTFAGLINSYVEHFSKTGCPRSIWVTEFGYTTFWFNVKNSKGISAGFSEEAQAVYLVRRYLESFTLPIKASCQYDFVDDYNSKEFNGEANYGLLRSDYSRKPSFYAIRRMNSIFNGYVYDKGTPVIVEKSPLQRSCMRSELVRDWDKIAIKAANGIKAFTFVKRNDRSDKILTVWSMLPYSTEFNNRACNLRVKGLAAYSATPVVIDLVNGQSYDFPVKVYGNDLVFENLSLKHHPVVIKLVRK